MKFLKKFENFEIDQSTEIDEQDYLLNRKKSQYSPFSDDMEEEEDNDVPEPNEEITLERKKSAKKEEKKPFFLKKKDEKEGKEKGEKTDSSKLSKSQMKLPLALQKAILAKKK